MTIIDFIGETRLQLDAFERGVITDEEFWDQNQEIALEVLAARVKARRERREARIKRVENT